MREYLDRVKIYKNIQDELGIIGHGRYHITVDRIKQLSTHFKKKVKVHCSDGVGDPDRVYVYYLDDLKGISFVAVSKISEGEKYGINLGEFEGCEEIWG